MADKFNDAIKVFPENIREKLNRIPENIKRDTYEIRVRKDKPLILCGKYSVAFVGENSLISHLDCTNALSVSHKQMNDIISAVCGYSVYAHQGDMTNGFVTYGQGNRVGFCAAAVYNDNIITGIKNITSLNIRIARNYSNAADYVLDKLYTQNDVPRGIIIAGAPCTGKTTLLKSIAYKLSSEYKYGFKKCAVIDERFEMSTVDGVNCDILSGFDKESGIVRALRTLSPQIIICDEISTVREAEKVIGGFYSGVNFIVSIHAENKSDLLKRDVVRKLTDSGFFEYIVLLDDFFKPEILSVKELTDENYCDICSTCKLVSDSTYNYTKRKAAL